MPKIESSPLAFGVVIVCGECQQILPVMGASVTPGREAREVVLRILPCEICLRKAITKTWDASARSAKIYKEAKHDT